MIVTLEKCDFIDGEIDKIVNDLIEKESLNPFVTRPFGEVLIAVEEKEKLDGILPAKGNGLIFIDSDRFISTFDSEEWQCIYGSRGDEPFVFTGIIEHPNWDEYQNGIEEREDGTVVLHVKDKEGCIAPYKFLPVIGIETE